MNGGFGWSFYGFFVVAALWCVAYNVWAVYKNAREQRAANGAAQSPGDRGDDVHPASDDRR